jgi:hypothetical protein
MISIAASEAMMKPKSQNSSPKTGADKSGRIAPPIGFDRGIVRVQRRRVTSAAPAQLLDANPEHEQDAGSADHERKKPGIERNVVGECNDRDEKDEQDSDQRELFPPITSLIGRHCRRI